MDSADDDLSESYGSEDGEEIDEETLKKLKEQGFKEEDLESDDYDDEEYGDEEAGEDEDLSELSEESLQPDKKRKKQ